MLRHVRHFSLVKAGNAPSEYEDGAAWDEAAGRAAVADGATETSFSGPWADALVQAWVRRGGPRPLVAGLPGWLDPLARAWSQGVPKAALPWYAQAKAEAGAAAAFLGLSVGRPAASGRGRWHALAVGDSCLFHLRPVRRETILLRAFPVCDSRGFGSTPALVPTNRRAWPHMLRAARVARGGYRAGDTLLLTTDALGHFLLSSHERGEPAWDGLLAWRSDEQLARWISDLRSERRIRNDDVTALVVTLSEPLELGGSERCYHWR